MAVTDMTDSLPWWARQGAPQGGPGATPMGANGVGWLQYLSQMFGPEAAAQLSQGGNPANMPSPDASETGLTIIDNTADHGTGNNPPVPPFAVPPAPPVVATQS